jgi:hypothetical protein
MSKVAMIKGISLRNGMLLFLVAVFVYAKVVPFIAQKSSEQFGSGAGNGTFDSYLYIGAITFLVLVTLFGGWHILKDKPFASKVVAYAVAVVILLSSVVWLNFGYIDGDAFDSSTGDPNYMYDPTTGKIDKNYKPVECRPPSVSHKGYDYSRFEGCYSKITGAKLLPMPHEVARMLQPDTWASIVYEWIHGNEAKQAAVDAEMAAKVAAKVAALKAEAAARADIEKQRQASMKKPETLEAKCDMGFSAVTNCVKVTFRNGGVYQRTAKKDMCLGYDKKSLIKEEPLGDSTYRYSSINNEDVTVHFYDKKLGQYFDNSTCG